MYSPSWRNGVPKDYPEPGLWWPTWMSRTPRIVQVLHLEQYADSLENLKIYDSSQQAQSHSSLDGGNHALHYRVSLPLEENQCFLERDFLAFPLLSSLDVASYDGQLLRRKVDLIETLNTMWGVHVESIEHWINPATSCPYTAVIGRKGPQCILILWKETGDQGDCLEWSFLKAQASAFDLVYTNDPQPPAGLHSLLPLFTQLLEGAL